VGEVEGEEEYRRGKRRPECRESENRMFLTGTNPGSRRGFSKSRLEESGGRRWIG